MSQKKYRRMDVAISQRRRPKALSPIEEQLISTYQDRVVQLYEKHNRISEIEGSRVLPGSSQINTSKPKSASQSASRVAKSSLSAKRKNPSKTKSKASKGKSQIQLKKIQRFQEWAIKNWSSNKQFKEQYIKRLEAIQNCPLKQLVTELSQRLINSREERGVQTDQRERPKQKSMRRQDSRLADVEANDSQTSRQL